MYANGQVPVELLVHVSGVTYLPPGTYVRWLYLKALANHRFGVDLRITSQFSNAWNAWNGYRPLAAQRMYRDAYGIMAAYPGTSSHGGTYRGQEVFAIDVENWNELGWANFAGLAGEAGFTVNFVTPQELWHIGDFNDPWSVPSFAGENIDGDDMTPEQDARLAKLVADVEWLKTRVGGKNTDPTLSSNVTGIAGIVQWLKERIGGSTKAPIITVTDRLRNLQGISTPEDTP